MMLSLAVHTGHFSHQKHLLGSSFDEKNKLSLDVLLTFSWRSVSKIKLQTYAIIVTLKFDTIMQIFKIAHFIV